MESVIFDDNNVPVFPHLLSHYVIDNDLDKERVDKKAFIPLESIVSCIW